jgi:hypothetical protein
MRTRRYIEIAVNTAGAYGAFYFFGWIGFAIWVFIVMCLFSVQITNNQQVIKNTLLSRLPDRCAFCHREIVDEGGIFDEDSIYHKRCIEKLESLEELRKEAGVRASEAVHRPHLRSSPDKVK